ncbi:hypothetical protein YC2023_097504 [Brassica napus]
MKLWEKYFHTRPKPLDFTRHSPIFSYHQHSLITGCSRCFRGYQYTLSHNTFYVQMMFEKQLKLQETRTPSSVSSPKQCNGKFAASKFGFKTQTVNQTESSLVSKKQGHSVFFFFQFEYN